MQILHVNAGDVHQTEYVCRQMTRDFLDNVGNLICAFYTSNTVWFTTPFTDHRFASKNSCYHLSGDGSWLVRVIQIQWHRHIEQMKMIEDVDNKGWSSIRALHKVECVDMAAGLQDLRKIKLPTNMLLKRQHAGAICTSTQSPYNVFLRSCWGVVFGSRVPLVR